MKRFLISLMFVVSLIGVSCESNEQNIFDADDINSLTDENLVFDFDTTADLDSSVEDEDLKFDNDSIDSDSYNDDSTDTDADVENDPDSDTYPDDDLIIPPFCGNKEIDEGEECDDGNKINTDSCKNDCTLNFCGDGYVNSGVEICDSSSKSCSSLGIGTDGVALCNSECSAWLTAGVCSRDQNCTGLPANAEWNTASTINQTWNGSTWQPTTSGIYNTTPNVIECFYKCKENYSWNGSQCIADTRTDQNCTGLPANAEWNIANKITQTWTGSDWAPSTTGVYNTTSSTTSCRFNCKTNYTWNSSTSQCNPSTRTDQNCTGLPANAEWNIANKITQTWTGSDWAPSTTGVYNTTSSTTSCRFKCKTNYTWNSSTSQCNPSTRTQSCSGLPSNGEWNTASSITQTWSGSEWLPSTTGVYSTESSSTECRYKCKLNYSWNSISSTCVADTKVSNCTGLPDNAEWNIVNKIIQTWSGATWLPTTVGVHNIIPSATECIFQCNVSYRWNGIQCFDESLVGAICTGQSKCYDDTVEITCPAEGSAFYGQDAQYISKCKAKNYTVTGTSGSDIVTDNNTGLIWQRTLSSNTYTWQGAINYCDGLSYAGQTDWRLPTRKELATLPDYGRSNPAIDTAIFPGTQSSRYWSSSSLVDGTVNDSAWYVRFDDGREIEGGKTTSRYVRCVRNDEWNPDSTFNESTVSGKVIVTDSRTGLIWQKEYENNTTWEKALRYCENSTYAGYSDWRLPNIEELKALINDLIFYPASSFPGMPTSYFWSSSSLVDSSNWAWYVNFSSGAVDIRYKTSGCLARCVR
jgi:cysteine-rich repeat protein